MIRLLQWLFFGHVHKWKTINKSPLHKYDEVVGVGEPSVGMRYEQQCETCGKVIKRDLV